MTRKLIYFIIEIKHLSCTKHLHSAYHIIVLIVLSLDPKGFFWFITLSFKDVLEIIFIIGEFFFEEITDVVVFVFFCTDLALGFQSVMFLSSFHFCHSWFFRSSSFTFSSLNFALPNSTIVSEDRSAIVLISNNLAGSFSSKPVIDDT